MHLAAFSSTAAPKQGQCALSSGQCHRQLSISCHHWLQLHLFRPWGRWQNYLLIYHDSGLTAPTRKLLPNVSMFLEKSFVDLAVVRFAIKVLLDHSICSGSDRHCWLLVWHRASYKLRGLYRWCKCLIWHEKTTDSKLQILKYITRPH